MTQQCAMTAGKSHRDRGKHCTSFTGKFSLFPDCMGLRLYVTRVQTVMGCSTRSKLHVVRFSYGVPHKNSAHFCMTYNFIKYWPIFKLFYCRNQDKIWNNAITKNPTAPQLSVSLHYLGKCQCFKSNNRKRDIWRGLRGTHCVREFQYLTHWYFVYI